MAIKVSSHPIFCFNNKLTVKTSRSLWEVGSSKCLAFILKKLTVVLSRKLQVLYISTHNFWLVLLPSVTAEMKKQFKGTTSLSVCAYWLEVHWEPPAWAAMCVCVSLSKCLFDWLCHTVRISRCEQPACVVSLSCAYIYFREMDGVEWHTRTKQKERETGAALHSDPVPPIIQYHERAETLGIDSQATGQQDRQTDTHMHTTHMHAGAAAAAAALALALPFHSANSDDSSFVQLQ